MNNKAMRNYVARLEYDDSDADREMPDWHGELCCLIQADSPELAVEPLRELLQRLHDDNERGALEGVNELYLVDIVELPEDPAAAILWQVGWKKSEVGMASVHACLLIDDSGRAEAYGWRADANGNDGESDEDASHTEEPFMKFERPPTTTAPDNAERSARRRKNAEREGP